MMRKNILILLPIEPFNDICDVSCLSGLKSVIEEKGHNVQMYTIPVNYDSVDSLWKQMYQWSLFDFEHFGGTKIDTVICTKWPSYYVKHHNKKVVFLEDIEMLVELFDIEKSERDHFINANRRILKDIDSRYCISEFISRKIELSLGLDSQPLYLFNGREGFGKIQAGNIISVDNRIKYNRLFIDAMREVAGTATIITHNNRDHSNLLDYLEARGCDNVKVEYCDFGSERMRSLEEEAAAYYYGVDKYRGYYSLVASAVTLKPLICVKDEEEIVSELIRESKIDVVDADIISIRKEIRDIFDLQTKIRDKKDGAKTGLLQGKIVTMNPGAINDIETIIC